MTQPSSPSSSTPNSSSSIPASTKQTTYSTRANIAKGSAQSSRLHHHLRTRSSDYGLANLQLAATSSSFPLQQQLQTPNTTVNLNQPTLRHYHSLSDQSFSGTTSTLSSNFGSKSSVFLPSVNIGSSPMSYSPADSPSLANRGNEGHANSSRSNFQLNMPDELSFFTPATSSVQRKLVQPASSSPQYQTRQAVASSSTPKVSSSLKSSSYGSTSSLMSFEDPNNSMYSNRSSLPPDQNYPSQPQQQQQLQQQHQTQSPSQPQQHQQQQQQFKRNSGTITSPGPGSFTTGIAGGGARTRYNPHASPHMQSLGVEFPQTLAAGSTLQPSIQPANHLELTSSPVIPYSPMTSTSPATPKLNPTHNPWASPLGTPTNHRLSPGRQQGQQGQQGQSVPISHLQSPLSQQPPPPQLQPKNITELHHNQSQPQQQQQQIQDSHFANSPLRQHMTSSSQNPTLLSATQAGDQQQQQSFLRRSMVHHKSTSQISSPVPLVQQSPQPQSSNAYIPNIAVPTFRTVRSKSELAPVINPQPKYRRALPEGGSLSPLAALTKQLSTTYHICNPAFNYQSSKNPRRILTKPGEGKLNNGFDNADNDYILYVNDILGIDEQRRYLVLDVLGQGTFGQVVKCQNMMTKEIVAVKVIKNKPAYLKQSMMEVSILDHLNNQVDKNDEHNLLRLKDRFMHKNHLCLVFELLSSNLYELVKRNNFRGLSINLVRVFAQQLLDSLKVLKEAKLIHCDLKPENILLRSLDSPVIKVIDFGSACHELQTVYTYIQSRFYRSPEVLLGLPYTTSIDMWSLGCIVAELFLGLPIFPGTSEYNQLSRIIDTLGNPPNWMIEMGKTSGQFMEKYVDEYGRKQYRLKSREKFSAEFKTEEHPSKQYFPSTKLNEIIMNYPLPKPKMKQSEIDLEMQNRASFVDFVSGLLNMNPFERWTPHQAAMHPFITESKFVSPFVPSLIAKEKMQPSGQHLQQSLSSPQAQQLPQQRTKPALAPRYQQAQPPQPQIQIQKPPVISSQQQISQPNIPAISVQSMSESPQVQKPQHSQQPQQSHLPQQAQSNHQRANMYYGSGNAYDPPQLQVTAAPSIRNPPYPTNTTTTNTNSGPSQSLATGWSTRRPRASTIGNMAPIPPPIQRATALMNPAQPIRAQPSPAYIPPPELINAGNPGAHRNSNVRADSSGDAVRHLEDGLVTYWS